MDALPGFVSIPRLAGINRPAGAFFSAVVEAAAGPGLWKVNLDGRVLVVSAQLDLAPGQVLKLQLTSREGARWLFKVLPAETAPERPPLELSPLMAAFLSRGLPLAADRLAVWSKWLSRPSPSDKESWAASLEARGQGPRSPLAEALSPWLAWQAALEEGRSPPPPEDESAWDEWNLRRTADDAPWLVLPLRWEYEGQTDAGLLQARWNPQRQAVDRWQLTAAPAGTPFRLDAEVRPEGLGLTWRFFREDQRRFWASWADSQAPGLSRQGLEIRLAVVGADAPAPRVARGLDVRA